MTLKGDAKFEEELNLDASSGKSKNLHFDMLLLPISYKVSTKKVQKNYLS